MVFEIYLSTFFRLKISWGFKVKYFFRWILIYDEILIIVKGDAKSKDNEVWWKKKYQDSSAKEAQTWKRWWSAIQRSVSLIFVKNKFDSVQFEKKKSWKKMFFYKSSSHWSRSWSREIGEDFPLAKFFNFVRTLLSEDLGAKESLVKIFEIQ